jgi:glutathione peroxidase
MRAASFHLAVAMFMFAVACKNDARPNGGTTMNETTSIAMPASVHELTVTRIDGKKEKLDAYKGKVLLIVNTASECGFTPQYEGLEKLHKDYAGKAFEVLGFPSNDFGAQEPGSNSEIAEFCRSKFGIDFPMFEKLKTTGADAAPLYSFLTAKAGAPKWNFHKYLIGKNGEVIKGFSSKVAPDSEELRAAINSALGS